MVIQVGVMWGPSIYGDNYNDHFGKSVDISGDGTLIGAESDSNNYVKVFEWVEGVWTTRHIFIGTPYIFFGHSISVTAFETRVVIGAPESNYNGEKSGVSIFTIWHLTQMPTSRELMAMVNTIGLKSLCPWPEMDPVLWWEIWWAT